MARRTVLLVLTILLLGLAAAPRPAAATPTGGLSIVFLPGLCGWPHTDPNCRDTGNAQRRATATFATLIAALHAAGIHYTPVYYSYNPRNPLTYSAADTEGPVARSVSAQAAQIAAIHRRDPHAEIDLVGHSLGGVIAASWTVTRGRAGGTNPLRVVRSYLHSIVTFDSPLKGIGGSALGALLQSVFGGQVWRDLQGNSGVIRSITRLPNSWWKASAHLHSIANTRDLLVPPSESLLGAKRTVSDGACPVDLLFIRSCHGATLSDAALDRYVACHWITTPEQCVPAPTATPIPTATATPTATPAPTSSPTATLSPTAAPASTSAARTGIPPATTPPPPPAP